MTAFLLWILSLVLVWNAVPHLFLWSLKGVEVEHKRRASKSFLAASLKGLVVLPFEMLAPIDAVCLAFRQTRGRPSA